MTLTPEKLDEIERGLEGVTPGPWTVRISGFRGNYFIEEAADAERRAMNDGIDGGTVTAPIRAHIARLDPQTVAELVRLARIGRDLEHGREQYVRGIRVHVPMTEGSF